MPADPRFSAGARLERRSVVLRLRRRLAYVTRFPARLSASEALEIEVKWLLKRQARYDKRKGGLGK